VFDARHPRPVNEVVESSAGAFFIALGRRTEEVRLRHGVSLTDLCSGLETSPDRYYEFVDGNKLIRPSALAAAFGEQGVYFPVSNVAMAHMRHHDLMRQPWYRNLLGVERAIAEKHQIPVRRGPAVSDDSVGLSL
jgi:hypothetical protein